MYSTILTDISAATPTLSGGWLICSAMLAGISVAMLFFPRMPSTVVAYLAMWAARFSGYAPFNNASLIFWGIATAIIVANHFMLPRYIRNTGVGLPYMAGGAVVGMVIGLTLNSSAAIIVGSMVGVILGGIAYARTHRGAALDFPSARFFNYLGAKGLPAVVASVMVGLVLAGLIIYSNVQA